MKRLIAFALAICSIILIACSHDRKVYETNDVSDYGQIVGNGAPDRDGLAQAVFNEIFPETLEPFFEDVHYHYKAYAADDIAFEINLEFTISSTDKFYEYVDTIAPLELFRPFPYDNAFLQFLPTLNFLHLSSGGALDSQDAVNGSYIDTASIERVLIDPKEQRVIYVALCAEEWGSATTEELDYFFNRFQIDPTEMTGIEKAYTYETTDVRKYGIIKGVDDSFARNGHKRYFPETIEPYFENVQYYRKILEEQQTAFEIYLEFTISDKEKFESYVNSIAPSEAFQPFPFNAQYLQYLPVDNSFSIYTLGLSRNRDDTGQIRYYRIRKANIVRTLINPEEQRVIYVMLYVQNGGLRGAGIKSTELNHFFDRFQIDPIDLVGKEKGFA